MDTAKVLDELDAIAARIANLRSVIGGIAPAESEIAKQRVAARQCTYCGLPLGKKKPNRGAHEACYRKAMRHIERGWTTDAKLVSDGLLLPQAKQGRKVAADDPVLLQMKAEAEAKAEALLPSEKSDETTKTTTSKSARSRKPRQ